MEKELPDQNLTLTSSESSQMEDDLAPAIFEDAGVPQLNAFAVGQVVEPGAQYQISIDGQEPIFMAIGSFEETDWTPNTPGVLKSQVTSFLKNYFTTTPFNVQVMICEDLDDEDHVKITDDGLHFLKCTQTKDTILTAFPDKKNLKNHVFSIKAAKLDDLTAEGDLHLDFEPQNVRCDLVSRLAANTAEMQSLFALSEVRQLLNEYCEGAVAEVAAESSESEQKVPSETPERPYDKEATLGKRSPAKPEAVNHTELEQCEPDVIPSSPLKLTLCNLSPFSIFGSGNSFSKPAPRLVPGTVEPALGDLPRDLISPSSTSDKQNENEKLSAMADETQKCLHSRILESTPKDRIQETDAAILVDDIPIGPSSITPADISPAQHQERSHRELADENHVVDTGLSSVLQIGQPAAQPQDPEHTADLPDISVEEEFPVEFEDFLVFTDEDMLAIDLLHRQNMTGAKEIDELFTMSTLSVSILAEEDISSTAEFQFKSVAQESKLISILPAGRPFNMDYLLLAMKEFENKLIDSAEEILQKPTIGVIEPAGPIEANNIFKLVPQPQQAPERSVAEWASLIEAELGGISIPLISEPEMLMGSRPQEDQNYIEEVTKSVYQVAEEQIKGSQSGNKEGLVNQLFKEPKAASNQSVFSSSKKPQAAQAETITSIVDKFLIETQKLHENPEDQVTEIQRVKSTSSYRDLRKPSSGVGSPKEKSIRNLEVPQPGVVSASRQSDAAAPRIRSRENILVDSDTAEIEVSTPSQLSNNPNNTAVIELELMARAPSEPLPPVRNNQDAAEQKLAAAMAQIDQLIPPELSVSVWRALLNSDKPFS